MPRTVSRAALDVHTRNAYLRALLGFFGPFAPIHVMVPAARADESRRILESVLAIELPAASQREPARLSA